MSIFYVGLSLCMYFCMSVSVSVVMFVLSVCLSVCVWFYFCLYVCMSLFNGCLYSDGKLLCIVTFQIFWKIKCFDRQSRCLYLGLNTIKFFWCPAFCIWRLKHLQIVSPVTKIKTSFKCITCLKLMQYKCWAL